MNVVLLRVGIDSGCGGIQGPLFADGRFEFIPIPDNWSLDQRTYGNTQGRYGQPLIEFFPPRLRTKMANQSMHVDPEFETFTYGDPTTPKRGLAKLQAGDLLVFYAGLEGFDCAVEPGLFIVGFFEVAFAGFARDFSSSQLRQCSGNFHVRHTPIFNEQKEVLVLVKGNQRSRLLKKAQPLSETRRQANGQPLKVLSREMQKVFGDFGGKISIQRSPPRWVHADHVARATDYLMTLK
jgi:hypothetical protein